MRLIDSRDPRSRHSGSNPGSVTCELELLTCSHLQNRNANEISSTMIPTLQRRKLRLRKNYLAQGYTESRAEVKLTL